MSDDITQEHAPIPPAPSDPLDDFLESHLVAHIKYQELSAALQHRIVDNIVAAARGALTAWLATKAAHDQLDRLASAAHERARVAKLALDGIHDALASQLLVAAESVSVPAHRDRLEELHRRLVAADTQAAASRAEHRDTATTKT